MKNRDNNSIAYLFREMDPSEEVEFERSLNENENLLIEVESFRRVTERLDDLPKLQPPKTVSDSVLSIAARRSTKSSFAWHKPIFYAAAAILMAGFTASALITEADSGSASENTERASVGSSSTLQVPFQASPVQLTSRNTAHKVSPWIDNNEIIRFSDRVGQNETASFDSIFRNSYQRLTPVTETDPYRNMQRRLQLTGSRP